MGATERVKEYIEYKGVTKYQFCKELGFSNKFLDNSSNMGTDKAGKILHYYPDLSPEWLLTGNGEMLLTKSEKNVTIKKGDILGDIKGDNPNVKKMSTSESFLVAEHKSEYNSKIPAVVTIDSHNEDNIALVPIPLSAGYLKGYNNPKFISKLPSYRMPGLNNGVFRMFEVQGNSMYPTIPNKSFVVGQFVENWIDDIKDNQVYAVISSELEDGLIKRCLNKIKKYNNLICKSDNRRNFPTQSINPESIKEIWEIKLHLNFQLPDPADVYDRISDLEGEVFSLKDIVKKLK